MDCKALIALLALIPALTFGQPMTVSELAWPRTGTGGVPCAQTISANGMVLIVPTNSVSAIALNGAGGVFAISVAPTNGTLTGLDTATGDATYTASASLGVDHFEFSVTGAGGCVTNAPVDVSITTNTVGCFDASAISHVGRRIGVVINTGSFGRDVLVCLQYTNADCVPTNDCKQSLGMGMVPFSVVEGVDCPNNSLCFNWSNPPPIVITTNYCGGAWPDDLTNVVWSAFSLGSASATFGIHTNGVVSFSTEAIAIGDSGMALAYTICGGVSNRTISVDGIVTNTFRTIGDNAKLEVGFVTQQTIAAGATLQVTPVHFTYAITGQVTNVPELEMIMHKTTTDGRTPNVFSGLLTNSFQ